MWYWIGFLLVSGLLGGAAYALSRRSQRTGILLAVLACTAICAKAALHAWPHWEWWLFPWRDYAFVQRLLMYPLAAVFFGVAAARLPVGWNRAVVLLVGAYVVAFGGHENAWMAWPQDHGRDRFADARHHLQQTTHYTCGPAACVSAVSHCGVRISERAMARLCITHDQGSRLFDLYRGIVIALEDLPFDVSIRDVPPDHLARPGLIVVSSNRGRGHAICAVGVEGRALVHDPLNPEPGYWDLLRIRSDYRSPAIVIVPSQPGTNPLQVGPAGPGR